MKSRIKTFSTIFLIFLFSTFGFSQAFITITLIVDTDKVNSGNLQETCHFEARWSDSNIVMKSTPGDLEGFLVDAFVGDNIIWEGKSSSSESVIVDIKKIKYKKGSRIFNNGSHTGAKPRGSKKEKVKAKVAFSTEGEADYKYDLDFKIKHVGKFTIDPKLRIGRR